MVALQTTEAVVPGSNPASLTLKNSRGQAESLCVYCKISGQRGKPPLEVKKRLREEKIG